MARRYNELLRVGCCGSSPRPAVSVLRGAKMKSLLFISSYSAAPLVLVPVNSAWTFISSVSLSVYQKSCLGLTAYRHHRGSVACNFRRIQTAAPAFTWFLMSVPSGCRGGCRPRPLPPPPPPTCGYAAWVQIHHLALDQNELNFPLSQGCYTPRADWSSSLLPSNPFHEHSFTSFLAHARLLSPHTLPSAHPRPGIKMLYSYVVCICLTETCRRQTAFSVEGSYFHQTSCIIV